MKETVRERKQLHTKKTPKKRSKNRVKLSRNQRRINQAFTLK